MPGLWGEFHYARERLRVFLYAICISSRPFSVAFQAVFVVPHTKACSGSQVLSTGSHRVALYAGAGADACTPGAGASAISAAAIGLRAVAFVHASAPSC